MITEDYVSFETAKLLKEKGFEGRMHTFYTEEGTEIESSYVVPSNFFPIYRPTLQMAMKWLREVHNIIIELHHQYRKEWYAIVSSENPLGIGVYATSTFNTYEQACEAAINTVLKI